MGQIANQMLANFITSIGNGEQIAGFKNIHTGEFHEVMLLKNDDDKTAFMRNYGLEKVEKEY